MSAVVKGTVVLGTPTIGAGGLYLYVTGLDSSMPDPVVAPNITTANKFGKDYGPYLVDKDNTTNQKWWEWSYENRFKKADNSKLSTQFSAVDSVDKLKEVCNTAYTQNTTDLQPDTSDANKAKYGNDTWGFCSVFMAKPLTIDDNKEGTDKTHLDSSGAYKDKLGDTKKTDLVSVNAVGQDNDKFWILKEKEFFGGNSDGTGKHTQTDENKKTIFNKLYDKKADENKEPLKKTCDSAYKQTNGTGDSDVKEADVLKFCGLKIISS